jgi:hypothetical protein
MGCSVKVGETGEILGNRRMHPPISEDLDLEF